MFCLCHYGLSKSALFRSFCAAQQEDSLFRFGAGDSWDSPCFSLLVGQRGVLFHTPKSLRVNTGARPTRPTPTEALVPNGLRAGSRGRCRPVPPWPAKLGGPRGREAGVPVFQDRWWGSMAANIPTKPREMAVLRIPTDIDRYLTYLGVGLWPARWTTIELQVWTPQKTQMIFEESTWTQLQVTGKTYGPSFTVQSSAVFQSIGSA